MALEILMRQSLLCLSLCLSGFALSAQVAPPSTATPKREARVEKRATLQQKRIAQGVATGQVTATEAARLERKAAQLDRSIDRAEADGKITRKEAAKLEVRQDAQSKRIAHKKHNAQVRK